MIPEGTDAVVIQEKVTVKGKIIHLKKQPSLGDNIRKIGEQIKKNETASASPDLIIVCEDLINEISHSSLLF
jgi:molybdopterin biosynthesis enzyme